MSKATSKTPAAVVAAIHHLAGASDEESLRRDAVTVHQALDVEGYGLRQLSRDSKVATGKIGYMAAAGAIIEEIPLEWIVTKFGTVASLLAFCKAAGRPAVMDALAEETEGAAWRALDRLTKEAEEKKVVKGEPKGGAKGGEETPETAWKAAKAAIERALAVTKDDSGKGLTLAMADSIAEAGAVMVQGLEIAETVRLNLEAAAGKDRTVTDGGSSVVKAGK